MAIWYTFISAVATSHVYAACHPIALSFLGKKDAIRKTISYNTDSKALLGAYLHYVVLKSDFPTQAGTVGNWLAKIGVNPYDPCTDVTTPIGWPR